MHVSLIHILSILQLIQEDILDAGNDKNEKEEVIKRKILTFWNGSCMRINPEDPTYSKEVLITTERINIYLHVIALVFLMKYHYICVEMWQSTIILSFTVIGLLDVIFSALL